MSDMAERMARIETWKQGHEDQCKERYQDIKSDTAHIMGSLSTISNDLKGAVERIHARIDGQDGRLGGIKVWVLSGVVAILLAIVGYTLVNGNPWDHPKQAEHAQ